MATTLFRINSNVRLSFMADKFNRLQLQHSSSAPVNRHSFQFRSITQSHFGLLRNATGADLTASQQGWNRDREGASSKPAGDVGTSPSITRLPLPAQTAGVKMKPRKFQMPRTTSVWTDEEDKELLRLVKEEMSADDIYAKHFPHRSYMAVSKRIGMAFKTARATGQLSHVGVRQAGTDIGKSATGDDEATPLRTVYSRLKQSARRNDDEYDAAIHQPEMNRRPKTRKGKWSAEEDELLQQLVHKYLYLPEPSIWSAVSGNNMDGSSPLLRGIPSCRRRWRRLYPLPSAQIGRWTKEEELRLQEAIWEQLDGKYQVAVDVLVGKPATTEHSLGQRRPELLQLPGQAGLPILKLGSRRLAKLNWLLIGEKVGSRTDYNCRYHFYAVYHNGNKGPWSTEESRRLKEGLNMFGKDYWRIAELVGTRSPQQVNSKVCDQESKKRQSKVVEGSKESVQDDS